MSRSFLNLPNPHCTPVLIEWLPVTYEADVLRTYFAGKMPYAGAGKPSYAAVVSRSYFPVIEYQEGEKRSCAMPGWGRIVRYSMFVEKPASIRSLLVTVDV